jgi:hypothetical protein
MICFDFSSNVHIFQNIKIMLKMYTLLSTLIRWHQYSWFLQNTMIHVFLNWWFQTLQAKNQWGKIVYRWILIFMVQDNYEIHEN